MKPIIFTEEMDGFLLILSQKKNSLNTCWYSLPSGRHGWKCNICERNYAWEYLLDKCAMKHIEDSELKLFL